MGGVDGVTGAGVVDVVAVIVGQGAIVGEVVDALEGQRRPHFVAFCRVVVDHVENDLDPGIVERAHHVAEPGDAAWTVIALGRREEAERVVAPEIAQALFQKEIVIGKFMDRHQFDGGDAEALDIADDRLVAHALEGAAQVFRDGGMQLGEALDMGLVENRVRPGDIRPTVVCPVMGRRIDDPAFRHEGRAVLAVEREILVLAVGDIAEMRGGPLDLADEFAGIGIDKQLVCVEAVTVCRIERAVHPVAIERARLETRHITMPDLVGEFRKFDARCLDRAAVIEKAEFHAFGMR